jgi:hypothetical protein
MEAWQSFTDHKGESVKTFETNQNERISTGGRSRQESARFPTDTAKFRFKAQSRHRSHQRIHQRHHYRLTDLSNGIALQFILISPARLVLCISFIAYRISKSILTIIISYVRFLEGNVR